ncbi:MAG: hypothetical protein ABI407_08060 [Bradyrhizobium sp.]
MARRLDQAARHVRVKGVAPVRAVHDDGKQSLIEFLQDHFVHRFLSRFVNVIASEAKQSI